MGSGYSEIKEEHQWHYDILPRATKRALDFLSHKEWLKDSSWYLAGGTAFALYAGHRKSMDLDFFIPQKNFAPRNILKHFSEDNWNTDVAQEGTIYGKLLGAKISFIAYPFFQAKEPFGWYGAVRVLSPPDIAVMKIIAISQRGKKRDFIDLYWYIKHKESLLTIIRRLPEQYPTVAHDYNHILKSLMYFADADQDPMPTLLFQANWRTIKACFRREIPKITKELLF